MVQCLSPALGRGHGYSQILLDFSLADELAKAPWPEAGVKGLVLSTGSSRDNAVYLRFTPRSLFNEKAIEQAGSLYHIFFTMKKTARYWRAAVI